VTFRGCLRERALRLTCHDVLRRVEDRHVVADDLGRRVTVDPAGAAVPGHDVPAWVEHEDRVVVHAVDEEAEPRLALAQFALRVAL
jgi:hypothetical protein